MSQSFSIVIVIILVLFAMYRRVRRNIGWQKLRRGNLRYRIMIFLIIGVLFLAGSAMHPISLISDVIGIGLGLLLAYYGVKFTEFEQREDSLYYRPNTLIGMIVTVLFLGRFLYRFYLMYKIGPSLTTTTSSGGQNVSYSFGNPWTTGLLLIMFAYYSIYYWVLLRKQKQTVDSKEGVNLD